MTINDLITKYKDEISENGKRLDECFQDLKRRSDIRSIVNCEEIIDEIKYLNVVNCEKRKIVFELMSLEKNELRK